MEKKILKWGCVLVSVCLVSVMSFLYVFPTVHARTLRSEEQEVDLQEAQQTAQTEDLTDYAQSAPEEVVETDENLNGRLKMDLPEGTDAGDVYIDNDYLTQTVTVRFPTDCKDYFSVYHLKGSCSKIQSISYYRDGDDGVVALALNMLYEIETDLTENSVYITFIDPHDIYDKVVVVDAGHGGKAAGATMDDICEKDVDLAIVLELQRIFQDSDDNIGVYFTRTDDSNPTLDQRVQMANKANADLFISIHNNASSNGKFSSLHGTQVLYSESDDSELSSEKLARICLDQVTTTCDSRSIGILKGDKIYIIRTSQVPVALIEVGFMTNHDELEKLNSTEYQKTAAQGIYNAIIEAFEEGF